MIRGFEKKIVGSGPGTPGTPAYVVRCMECGVVEAVRVGKPSGSLDITFLNKKFARLGWRIGRNASHDTCPECQSKSAKITEQNVERIMNNITPIKAEEPPKMTKEDRRIIFAKIDENYIDETNGYSGDWSDEKIAKDLNVPRAWVSQIREDNFGPEVGEGIAKDVETISVAIEKANAELAKMDERVESVRQAYLETVNRLRAARDAFAENIREAAARLDKITKKR